MTTATTAANACGFHPGPFHYESGSPARAPLAALYLAERRKFGYSAAAALVRARSALASNPARAAHVYAPTLRALYHAGNWAPSGRERAGAGDCAYAADGPPAGWREVGDSGSILGGRRRRNGKPEGWYTDSDGSGGTMYGLVLQLPARGGVPRYVPAIAHTEWDSFTMYPADWYEEKEEAARAADGYAERTAERERDYNDAWQAGCECGRLRAEASRLWQGARELVAEWRADKAELSAAGIGPDAPAFVHARALYLDRLESELAERARYREEADRLESACPDEYRDAFAEAMPDGAGHVS